MTKSHKLFQLINQISVMRVWGHTCRGKDWLPLVHFIYGSVVSPLGDMSSGGFWSTLSSPYCQTRPLHNAATPNVSLLINPWMPKRSLSSHLAPLSLAALPAWLLITLEFYHAFCDTLLHLPPSFWIALLCCFPSSVRKSQHKPARRSEAEDSMSVVLSLSSGPF